MITTIRETDYVVNWVVGSVILQEPLEFAQQNVDVWLSDPVLWDLTEAKMDAHESDCKAVTHILSNIHDLAASRKGKKTAFVTPDPLAFGMLRMAITIVECTEYRLVASVFNDLEPALAWLRESGF